MAIVQPGSETGRVVALLGGERLFGVSVGNARDLQAELRNGFPYAAFQAVLQALDLTPGSLAELLGIAPRTLSRRKAKGVLSPIESDRLYRVARVTAQAVETLGSLDKAREWLHVENQALGGSAPVGQLDTEIGERQVEDLLLRMDYGIYS
jgi:putative toxin-antitoxin system antitoxin component (TIGR02293 family)